MQPFPIGKNKLHHFKIVWQIIYKAMKRKVDLLWNSFKERMGISEFKQITLNLDDLIQPAQGLQSVEVQFIRKEIDDVVSKLPSDKSPGPNGYNNEFVKGCWSLIAQDFIS
jgi:hypothetical protein